MACLKLLVLTKFFLSGSFEDRAIFHVIQLSYDGGGALCAHYRSIDKYVKNAHNMALSSQLPLKKGLRGRFRPPPNHPGQG